MDIMGIIQMLLLIAALSIVALSSISRKRREGIFDRFYYYFSCFRGHCPTTKERRNQLVCKLAKRLEGESDKETLTNILEWQDRNIKFWAERHPIFTLMFYVYMAFVIVFTLGFFSLLFLAILNIMSIQAVFTFIEISFTALISSVTVLFLSMIFILHSNRKIPWRKIPDALKNVFAPSISIDFMLERGLGICKDYAKLTSCLLSNLYPEKKVYFAYSPGHAATGIGIGRNLYMLDQRLPVLTKGRWNDYRKPKKSDKIEWFDFTKNILKKVNKRAFHISKPRVDTEKLAYKMENLLNVKRGRVGNKTVKIRLIKNLYEDDEMVNYSLARYIKMKAADGIVDIERLTKIEAAIEKDDIIILLHYR